MEKNIKIIKREKKYFLIIEEKYLIKNKKN